MQVIYCVKIITFEKYCGLFGWLGERDYSSLPIPPTLPRFLAFNKGRDREENS